MRLCTPESGVYSLSWAALEGDRGGFIPGKPRRSPSLGLDGEKLEKNNVDFTGSKKLCNWI
ncbi:hypothetical protein [Laspinema palackyanum]|uniref:hypothetical protein n=1 Tax=Laspinema palackyanum TaxID=3231601 RepID=UPI00345D7D9A|nr:hypothetical protein [Laspinema sp. D2c]